MEIDKNELDVRTVWRKYLSYDKNGDIHGYDAKFAGVFCVREVSGYAVWYRRKLDERDVDGKIDSESLDGEYLLRFFAPGARHEAIEFAVTSTLPGQDSAVAIAQLNGHVKDVQRIHKRIDYLGPLEIVK